MIKVEEGYCEEPIERKEKIEDEQITVKEELRDEDYNLETKIEIVDDTVFKAESADLSEFLKGPTDDFVLELQKETEVKKEEITEEDPLSDTNNLMEQDPLEVVIKQERIENKDQTIKEP